jgi:hypothetical protein
MDPEQLQELLTILKDAGARSYECSPEGHVRLEFFQEQPQHEVVVNEQPTVKPALEQRVPGYDQLFNGKFPRFKNEPRG